ncbi:MAG: flagellar hook-associated protein FlgK [Bacillota bacterium]|nr:flagellar hook-associated protein FlgK [Bacillota bacterium]
MRTTFFGLNIAVKGLQTQQRALDVTGHNIANANTPGFTRQNAVIGTTTPWTMPGMNKAYQAGQVGTGVQVQEIRRIRDNFIDLQVRNESKELGYWESRADVLQKIEVVVNEPSDSGVRTVLDQFWESMQELSKNPESQAVRATVRQRAIAVADTFNHIDRQLHELQQDINATVNVKVDEINSLATQIRDLSFQIVRVEANKFENANDLRDRRDNLLDQLSKIADIRYIEDPDGSVRVSVGGKALVTGTRTFELAAVNKGDMNGVFTVEWKDGTPLYLSSGELKGYIEAVGYMDANGVQQGIIPSMMKEMDHLANSIVTAVNWVHMQGYSLAGEDGILFFNQQQVEDPDNPGNFLLAPINARNMKVSQAIIDDPSKIAASRDMDAEGNTIPGDNTNALALAELKHKLTVVTDANYTLSPIAIGVPDGSTTDYFQFLQGFLADNLTEPLEPTATFDDYFRGIIGQLGINTQEAERMALNQDMLVGQQMNRREILSGVSLDEEMSSMIMFQHAYNAAARAISTMDEMLDVLINRVGAGR